MGVMYKIHSYTHQELRQALLDSYVTHECPVPGKMVLHHIPCKEMQFLRVASGNSLLEPMGMNHFSPRKSFA